MHIGRISKAVVDLLGQVDEILEFSRAEAGFASLSTDVTDLRQLVEEVAGLVEPLFRERGLDFEVRVAKELRPIRTDRAKVRRILLNLLSNAQKYTTAGSVHLVVSQGYDDSVTAAVTDTGPGIDFEQQRRIFEPFERLRRPDDPGGTGLGLTVARSLARLLGGEITLDSARGQGSRFSVRVPHLLHPEASAASAYAEA
jgi:signal transduction histidine kinase